MSKQVQIPRHQHRRAMACLPPSTRVVRLETTVVYSEFGRENNGETRRILRSSKKSEHDGACQARLQLNPNVQLILCVRSTGNVLLVAGGAGRYLHTVPLHSHAMSTFVRFLGSTAPPANWSRLIGLRACSIPILQFTARR
jgi:hypothetical protein